MYHSIVLTGQPSCPTNVQAMSMGMTNCTVVVMWTQDSQAALISTNVSYCPMSSPSCGAIMQCNKSNECEIEVGNDTTYIFEVIAYNNCGNRMDCSSNTLEKSGKERCLLCHCTCFRVSLLVSPFTHLYTILESFCNSSIFTLGYAGFMVVILVLC